MHTTQSTAVIQRIQAAAETLREQAAQADDAGRLPEATAQLLRDIGVVRLLQSTRLGGAQAKLTEFLEAVMAIAALNPAAGWVSGVVGVHPWEISQADPRVAEEIWGEDPDTWVASPYAPMGRAVAAEGGFTLSGHWQFSSGTDNCDWIVLGGLVLDAEGGVGSPPDSRHFLLPRADYTIVEGSWNVLGLSGTGSKDIVVENAFVPAHRVIDTAELMDGRLAERNHPDTELYALPFGTLFSYAIGSATVGIVEGGLQAFTDYTRDRVGLLGDSAKANQFQLAALSSASADISASRLQLLDGARRMEQIVASGRRVSEAERLELRCSQVAASRRAVDALDRLFAHAGGGSLRLEQPFQRYWRDAHAAMNHLCNIAEPIQVAYGQSVFGAPHSPAIFY